MHNRKPAQADKDDQWIQCTVTSHSVLTMYSKSIDSLTDWLFNGTLTQKVQFVPTAGEGNQLSRLRMANKIQCILPHVTR